MDPLFDTNVFIDIQDGCISASQYQVAREKIAAEGLTGRFSPLSLIELGSHINDANQAQFPRYQGALRVARDLCRGLLTEPDSFIRKVMFAAEGVRAGISASETAEIIDTIIQASSYEDLKIGKIKKDADGILYQTPYQQGFLREFRQDYELEFLKKMNKHVRELLIPDLETKKLTGQLLAMPKSPLRTKVISFIQSDDFAQILYKSQAERFGVPLVGEAPDWDKKNRSQLAAFTNAYVWILRKIIESGYNIVKHKNDFNDLHFLMYLADPGIELVTSDGGFNDKLASGTAQVDRIVSFSDWLAK